MLYEYMAKVDKVVDGDTIYVTIDLGINIFTKQKLRLKGINAPETRGEEKVAGMASKEWLTKKVLGKQVRVVTYKDKTGKYGRLLADIFIKDEWIQAAIVGAGHAVYKDYS